MTTAISEAPASSTVAPELGLFTFLDSGYCVNPEEVLVRDLPKGHELKLYVAQGPDGLWRSGYWFNIEKTQEGERIGCDLKDDGFATRALALIAGLKATAMHFEKSKKATAAIEALYDKLKADAECVALNAEPIAPAEVVAQLPKGRFAELPVAAITPNPENHRKFHDAIKAKELLESIRQTGLLQPIAVRLLMAEELGELPVAGAGIEAQRFEIILGERRWRAHVAGGMATIEAKVYEGVSRADAKAAALIENLQRQDVNQIEEAEGYLDLMQTKGLTQAQCADQVGRSRPVVANALRVLQLPSEVIDLIRENKLTMAHGMALHKYAGRPEVVKIMAEQCMLHATSAGQLETWNRDDYVPFFRELAKAGIIAVIHRSDLPCGWGSEWPEAWATDADYQDVDGYSWICWEPAKAREFMDGWRAEVKAAQEKEAAKREQAKKKHGIKSLDDLERGQYRHIDPARQAEISDLFPESKVMTLKEGAKADAETVTVCLVPKFAEAVIDALNAAKRADREAKLPALLAAARAKVKKWKKLGADELAIVLAVLSTGNAEDAMISPASAKAQGVTIPAALKLAEYDGYQDSRMPADLGKAIKALAGDPVGYARVMVDDYLVASFTGHWERMDEPAEWHFHSVTEAARAVLVAILDDPLGLLEDTAAGRRKLAAQVRALPWYAAAYEQASKAGEDMGEIEDVTTDPKILAEWVKAQGKGMSIAEIARSYGVPEADVSGALAGRGDAKEGEGDE